MKDDIIMFFLLAFAVWEIMEDEARRASDKRICRLEERIDDLERD